MLYPKSVAFRADGNWADIELTGSGQPVQLADIKRGAIAMSASAPEAVIRSSHIQCLLRTPISVIQSAALYAWKRTHSQDVVRIFERPYSLGFSDLECWSSPSVLQPLCPKLRAPLACVACRHAPPTRCHGPVPIWSF